MSAAPTPLCRSLGIRYPIFNAGIGTAARPQLAAAVSNAGGLGVIGCSALTPEQVRAECAAVRALTPAPFGVNFIIDEVNWAVDEGDHEMLRAEVAAAAAEHVAVIVLFWGDATDFVPIAHRHDVRVFLQVGSVDEARAAVKAGVDAVIAQGVEAGGHVLGTTSIWKLLPAVVEAVAPVPVVASGGIGDAEGVAKALSLGAQAVSLGTRFVASEESNCHRAYKERVVASTAADTVLNELYDVHWPNAPHRTLRNKALAEWEAAGRPPSGARPGEGTSIGKRTGMDGQRRDWPRYSIGVATPDFDGDVEYSPMWAGQSCTVVNDIKPAGDIVRELAGVVTP